MSTTGTQTIGFMVKDANGSSSQIQQLETLEESAGALSVTHGHSGDISPTHESFVRYEPSIAFAGSGLKMYLDTFGLQDYDLGNAANELDIYLQEFVQGAARAATGEKLSVSKGLAFLLGIDAPLSSIARASGVILPDSTNGILDPITRASGQSIPADSYTEKEWGMGKVTLNSTDVSDLLGWTLELGNQEIRLAADPDVYITFSSLLAHAPVLTLTVGNVKKWISDFGITGRMTDLVFYLREKALGGTYTADASVVHIKFTGVEGAFALLGNANQNLGPGVGTIRIGMVKDAAGTAPLAVNTAIALT